MARILTVAGQCLVSALFVALGFGTYGCGDTGSVNPGPELARLSVSGATLQPSFNSATTQYRVGLSSSTTSVIVSATKAEPSDVLSGAVTAGAGQATGQATIQAPDQGSSKDVSIAVRASDGSTTIYTISLVRAALGGDNTLRSLTVSPSGLNPPFTTNTTDYDLDVGSGVGTVTVTAAPQDTNATMTVTSNGQVATSGQARIITLRAAGLSTTINIVVTAQNGAEKTYRVTVDRTPFGGNANLGSLTVSPPGLNPSFTASTTNYNLDVGSGVGTVTVTAAPQDTNATMTVTSNGQVATSGQARIITLRAAGLSTTINIAVTAQNTITEKTYTVTVDRASLGGNANLGSLTVSAGTLSPSFSASRPSYTVNVGSGVSSIAVTAAPEDPRASLRILVNGVATTTSPIPLPEGPSTTEIEIVVTAENGTTEKPYIITVNRAAPAAPQKPAAPDLIDEDDSGVFPEDRIDNITNVTTPRFRIPQPGAGETPSLYVGGKKVDSTDLTFDATANTLRRNTAFEDGTYTITSTVSNAGGESPESDPLDITIDTAPPVVP